MPPAGTAAAELSRNPPPLSPRSGGGRRDLAAEIKAGNPRGLARAISLIERRDPSVRRLLGQLGSRARRPYVLGVTGAPGTGKSTLVDALVASLRSQKSQVAVIAVDPNSPFSGGAILGDRIRMQRHTLDPGVYIRSMGARGHMGGLSVATREVVRLLGAYGFDFVILETVGVGQSELEVAAVADTTLVVLVPGAGDSVQMSKAGILEIADVFVVNKADLPGAQRTLLELRSMLSLGPRPAWKPPILATVAVREEGLAELQKAIAEHRHHLETSGAGKRVSESRLKDEAADLVGEWARAEARRQLDEDGAVTRALLRDRAPFAAAEAILARPVRSRTARG